jgi:hypothetical protein
MRKRQAAEAEKKELLDRHAKPSGVSDEERMKRGYRLKYQIADWPNGMPGDISITLAWG